MSSIDPKNPPAFPSEIDHGMTLRDYFAAHAPPLPHELQHFAYEFAQVNSPDRTLGEKCDRLLDIVSEWRYRYADAMLAARGGGK